MTQDIEDFLAGQELLLLEVGGIDNWDWYSDAVEGCNMADPSEVMNALDANGVDNWTWYGESMREFLSYRDYVHALPDWREALLYNDWEAQQDKDAAEAAEAAKVAEEARQAAKNVSIGHLNVVRDEGTSLLHDEVVRIVGEEQAEDITAQLLEDGFWKRSTFPKEFQKSLEVLSVPGTGLSKVRVEYVRLLTANKKLVKKVHEYL